MPKWRVMIFARRIGEATKIFMFTLIDVDLMLMLITCSPTVEKQNAKLCQAKYRPDTKLYGMY